MKSQYVLVLVMLMPNFLHIEGTKGFSVEPTNTILTRGGTLTLSCGVKGATQGNQITWYHYNGTTLTDFTQALDLQFGGDKVETGVTMTGEILTLTVDDVDETAAGLYGCREVYSEVKLKYILVDVIVLESNLTCVLPDTDDGLYIAPEALEIQCDIGYHGNLSPLVTWTNPDVPMTTGNNLKGIFNASSAVHGQTISASVFFPSQDLPGGSVYDNVKNHYRMSDQKLSLVPNTKWTSASALDIRYPPEDMKLTNGDKAEYDKGETISCSAEGRPAVSYKWLNVATGDLIVNGTDYTVPEFDDDAEGNVTNVHNVQCVATNTIRGTMHNNRLDIKIHVKKPQFPVWGIAVASVGGLAVIILIVAVGVTLTQRSHSPITCPCC